MNLNTHTATFRLSGAVVLLLACLLSTAAADSPDQLASPPQRPNIVFILADDLGWTALGSYGSEYHETPNLDRLAAQGMKFTAAYSNGPNCAPTRASLMSGQYPPRHGIYTVNSGARGRKKFRELIPPDNRTVLPLEIVTIAEALKNAGYVTAHMGKWHLGNPPKTGPKQQGFDVNIGGYHLGRPISYFSPYHNPYLEAGPKGEYLTDRLTEEALEFIENNRNRPFFLYLAHYAVHTPLQAKKSLVKKYKEKEPTGPHDNPVYAAMIESLDQSVGRIMAKLDELGLTDQTLVVFTSDNGGVGGYRAAGVKGALNITSNAPLRGGKGMLYEGGIRVPLIIRWPGVVKPGSTCDVPVITVDFYPTFLDITGAQAAPPTQPLDGRSLMPLLTSAGEASLHREALYWHFPGYLQASSRRGTWRTTPAGAIRRGKYKLIEFFESDRLELYNLKQDISETTNLVQELPQITRQLHRMLRDWRRTLNAAMPRPMQQESNDLTSRD